MLQATTLVSQSAGPSSLPASPSLWLWLRGRSETRKVSQELTGCRSPGSLLDGQEQEGEGPGTKGGWKPVPLPPPRGARVGRWLSVFAQACVGSCRAVDEAKGSGRDASRYDAGFGKSGSRGRVRIFSRVSAPCLWGFGPSSQRPTSYFFVIFVTSSPEERDQLSFS